jgi:flagellar motor switch protein FliG
MLPLEKDPQHHRTSHSLRRIAILLHTLPERTHRALLGQLDSADKQRVYVELESIGEIDVMEQHRVLVGMRDALQAERRNAESVESEIQDEIQIGRARVSKKRSHAVYPAAVEREQTRVENHPSPTTDRDPSAVGKTSDTETNSRDAVASEATVRAEVFAEWLHRVRASEIEQLLDGESSQTIAIVLSHSPDAHARAVLGRLPIELRGESLQQLAALDALPRSVVDWTLQHIQAKATGGSPTKPGGGDESSLGSLSERFSHTQAAGVLPQFNPHGFNSPVEVSNLTTMDVARSHQAAEQKTGSEVDDAVSRAEAEAEREAARIDRILNDLSPKELARALGMVTTKQAFLVLCGLSNETAETILDLLPTRQARKVRSDMRRMGQLQLSEIDAAKREVAQIAIRLTTEPCMMAA